MSSCNTTSLILHLRGRLTEKIAKNARDGNGGRTNNRTL